MRTRSRCEPATTWLVRFQRSAESGETRTVLLLAAGTGPILIVVGELYGAHAKAVKEIHPVQISADRGGILAQIKDCVIDCTAGSVIK